MNSALSASSPELPRHASDIADAAQEIAAFALARLNLHADVQSALSIAVLLVECEGRHFDAERLQKKFHVSSASACSPPAFAGGCRE